HAGHHAPGCGQVGAQKTQVVLHRRKVDLGARRANRCLEDARGFRGFFYRVVDGDVNSRAGDLGSRRGGSRVELGENVRSRVGTRFDRDRVVRAAITTASLAGMLWAAVPAAYAARSARSPIAAAPLLEQNRTVNTRHLRCYTPPTTRGVTHTAELLGR